MAGGKLPYNTGSSARGPVMTWGGWGEEGPRGRGIYVYTLLIHFVVQQKLTQFCKAIMLQQ